jgi:hypothetical protein
MITYPFSFIRLFTDFTPAQFTNLWDWWSADSGVATSGSNVTSWTGYNGNVLTPFNTSYYPSYAATNASFKGYPSINVNPTQVNTDCGFITNLPNINTSKTLILIGRLKGKTGGDWNALITAGPGQNPRMGIWGGNTNNYLNYIATGAGDQILYDGTTFVTGTYQLIRLTYNRTTGQANYYHGNSLTDLTTASLTINSLSGYDFTNGKFCVTSYNGSYEGTPNMDIVESVFINGIPTANEMTQYKIYLEAKYGLT